MKFKLAIACSSCSCIEARRHPTLTQAMIRNQDEEFVSCITPACVLPGAADATLEQLWRDMLCVSNGHMR